MGVENAVFSWREIVRFVWATGVFLGGKSHDHHRFKKRFFKSSACLAKRFSAAEVKFEKRTLSCLFGARQKVQVTRFAFEDFIFVVGSAANSVGTTLEMAGFRSGPAPNIADLVASAFFCLHPNTFSQKNTRLFSRLKKWQDVEWSNAIP